MASQRNRNQAPVVRQPELERLEVRVNQLFEALAHGHQELLRRQQVLEAAYLSLTRDIDVILNYDGGEEEGPEPPSWDDEPLAEDPGPADGAAYVDLGEGAQLASLGDDDESPEEEAARLIAEAKAAVERANEGA